MNAVSGHVASRRVETADSFPSVRIASVSGGLPVDVSLIAQLGPGAGNQLVARTGERQRRHGSFVDALQEPSAKLADVDPVRGDLTSLYSFIVGADAHPFHRHAGHRVFTAVSGSGGTLLRFSTASDAQIEADPQQFLHALHSVTIPPDCLFTVRFGGGTWHQFAPLDVRHPALFALSCHTNELGGSLSNAQRDAVLDGHASIPGLTELLPSSVMRLLVDAPDLVDAAPTVALSFEAPTDSLKARFCASVRSGLGRLRAHLTRMHGSPGFLTRSGRRYRAISDLRVANGSLLGAQFNGLRIDHEDVLMLELPPGSTSRAGAAEWMNALLEGFLMHQPAGVARLMALRNVLVRPLRLRTSPLACPVSSLLNDSETRFAQRFPVLDVRADASDQRCEVLLGADDRHLQFRSSVTVQCADDGGVRVSLATRVHCRNTFGRFYMRVIERAHRHYIAPNLLAYAVDHALELSAARHADSFAARGTDAFAGLVDGNVIVATCSRG